MNNDYLEGMTTIQQRNVTSIYEPQNPLYHKEKDAYFYPLTSEKQIVMDDGRRLNAVLKEDFAKKDEVNSAKAEAIDDSKVYTNEQVKRAAPRNLLDNSDFTNPVNQRGQEQYIASGVHTIDRWFGWHQSTNTHITIYSGYIKVWAENTGFGSIAQRFAKGILSHDKQYTFAYKTYEGNIVINNSPITFTETYDYVEISLRPNETVNVVWMALYEGEYTIDTLPEYQPKGYGAELAECQRYYFESDFNTQAIAFDAYSFYAPYMYLPVQMRENCNISVIPVSKNGTQNALSRWTGSEYVDVTNYIPVASKTAVSFRSDGGFVTGSIYATGKVIVSADIL